MTTDSSERQSAVPPRKEMPRWMRRLRRVLVYIDTAGMSEWVRVGPPKKER